MFGFRNFGKTNTSNGIEKLCSALEEADAVIIGAGAGLSTSAGFVYTGERFEKHMLRGIKYDELYLKENMKYFDAKDIPHFNEKTPDGVFNAEYDCCLDTSPTVSEDILISWIKEG